MDSISRRLVCFRLGTNRSRRQRSDEWRGLRLQARIGGREVKDKGDGAGVADLVGADEVHGFTQGKFENFDVFALLKQTTAEVLALGGAVGREIKVHFFADGAGAGIPFESFLECREREAELVERFVAESDFGIGVVEDAAAALQEAGFGGVAEVDGHAELAGEEDFAGFGVVGQEGNGVAAIEELAFLREPGAVPAPNAVAHSVEGGPGGAVLGVVNDFDFGNGEDRRWRLGLGGFHGLKRNWTPSDHPSEGGLDYRSDAYERVAKG